MNLKSSYSHKNRKPESGLLYIVGTPIGNLSDISHRALEILKDVSFILCEDTRQTQKLMNRYELTNSLKSFNKINSSKKIPKIINALLSGKSIALVSDAGMPSICDPGEDLIKEVRSLGLNIICIPGPCAASTALVSSGFPSSKFIFEGFPPKKQSEREKLLLEISKNEKTTILYESPYRLKKLLLELKLHCGGEREIQVFRELTKKFEEHVGADINGVINFFEKKEVLGEITVVIKGITKSKKNSVYDKSELKKELLDLVNAGLSLPEASKYLAKKKNISKKEVYNTYEKVN